MPMFRGIHRRRATRTGLCAAALVVAATGVAPTPSAVAHDGPPTYLDGSDNECPTWKASFLGLGFSPLEFDVAEEGWVWVDPQRRLQSASGVVTKSKIAHNDTPANHYSHDWNVDLRVDAGQQHLLSDVNGRDLASDVPQKIELEWETGIRPTQTSGADDDPFFPAWATPSVGDRVWTNGHWVFDCGHTVTVTTEMPVPGDPTSCPEGLTPGFRIVGQDEIEFTDCRDGHYRSEIHPGRAIATMRSQMGLIPGSGSTPVPVTATDLWVHGRGGFMVQQLACGIGIILEDDGCGTTSTPIDDLYSFDICLPPKPAPQAVARWAVTDGPGSTLDETVALEAVPAGAACQATPVDASEHDYDDTTMLRAVVDLRGSGAAPTDALARHIVSGWAYPEAAAPRRLSVRLDQMDLHQDHEGPGFNGEMSFLWMGVDQAPSDEWHRLVHFDIPTVTDSAACFEHTNTLNDYDDDGTCGNGLLNFSGPTWEFYPLADHPFTVGTRGFEQDCYDENFGDGDFGLLEYVECHGGDPTEIEDWGNNEKLAELAESYGADIAPGRYEPSAYDDDGDREYEMEFVVGDVALTDEDTAGLSVAKDCTYPGEVALAGQPFTCSVVVTNEGPGLPRDVVLTDTVTSTLPSSQWSLSPPVATVGTSAAAVPCTMTSAAAFTCAIGSIPVGETATVVVAVNPQAPGSFGNVAVVATASTDPDSADDVASDTVLVHLPVAVDVQPVGETGGLGGRTGGQLPVAVLTTPTFDATRLLVTSLCFGDAEAPAERDCTEAHGRGHVVDIDKDRDADLSLHYEVAQTGIDPGDTRACLIGRTVTGVAVYGCDAVRTV